jgi:hypothetical protein
MLVPRPYREQKGLERMKGAGVSAPGSGSCPRRVRPTGWRVRSARPSFIIIQLVLGFIIPDGRTVRRESLSRVLGSRGLSTKALLAIRPVGRAKKEWSGRVEQPAFRTRRSESGLEV